MLHTLSHCAQELPFCAEAALNCQKFTATEERIIVQYILNLDLREFAPWLCKVAGMADKLLAVRSGKPVSKC
jgi:hypothetical protein